MARGGIDVDAMTDTLKAGWPTRGAILGFVVAAHIALVLGLLSLHPVRTEPSWMSETNALEVRFIDVVPPRVDPPASAAPAPSERRPPAKAATRSMVPSRNTAEIPMPPTLARASPTPAVPRDELGTFIPGGALFKKDGAFAGSGVRLPGDPLQKGAPALRMVDPRTQGMAGVVRIIGSFTGAVDKHCLDLDAWQGMTPEERVAHHVSESDIARLRDNYGCNDPRKVGPVVK
ncbi:MAG: hypothetical protein GAK28_01210 [Luteibacter sp.]|nr:MAG: hypothetical protein GAK28_01210 [Luteibacter sp.]